MQENNKSLEKTKISIIDYKDSQLEELETRNISDCEKYINKDTSTWINIIGTHDKHLIKEAGKSFGIHPLVVEDIMHTTQRPKVEDYDGYLYIVLHMLAFNDKTHAVSSEQISIVLGKNLLLSFQEKEGDVFNQTRERIRNKDARMRKLGSDYLCYMLLDAIIDSYFHILEEYGDYIEKLQNKALSDPQPKVLNAIHSAKRNILKLRRAVWPLREVVLDLDRAELPLVKKSTKVYLRDVYDHTIQVIDTVEMIRDMATSIVDTYLSSVSNRMNEVMKMLTIIATIFIPLTFITGLYGMNFKYMPEIYAPWGYPAALSAMALVTIGLIIYFKKKKWL